MINITGVLRLWRWANRRKLAGAYVVQEAAAWLGCAAGARWTGSPARQMGGLVFLQPRSQWRYEKLTARVAVAAGDPAHDFQDA